MSPARFLLFIIGTAVVLSACRQSRVETYVIPKETASTLTAPTSPGLHWSAPVGWKESPAGGMRAGSFAAMGANGQSVDISVVVLAGEAGGVLANINRWRGQIDLPPLTEKELSSQSERMTRRGRSFLVVDFANDKKRVTAAILKLDDKSWFFKMTGEDAAVREQRKKFFDLLDSIHIDRAPHD